MLATGRFIGEGFDDARLDTLFLACRSRGRARSCSTRAGCTACIRGKTEVRIYDYVDSEVPMLARMFERRLRGYRAIGYARGRGPAGLRRGERARV